MHGETKQNTTTHPQKSARSEVTCLWTYRRDEGAHLVLFQLKYIASLLSVPDQMHDV